MNKVLSAYGCSWLTTWWGKGVFHSPCSPCSEHNRVPHTHYLITSKNRFLHISSTRKLEEREKTYFSFYFPCQLCLKQCHTEQLLDSFHTSFSSQGVSYTNVSALGAPGALLLLPSLCWIHLVPEAPFQPSLGSCPALLTPQLHWLLCWDPSVVHRSLVSRPVSCILSFSSGQELLDGPWPLFITSHVRGHWWTLLQPLSLPTTARACGAASTGEAWSHPHAPLRGPVPHWGKQLWQCKCGKVMAMKHLHLAVFLCSSSKEH